MSKIAHIFNYLDTLTVEDVLKYAVQDFEFIINDGHVQGMIMRKEDPQDGKQTANT